MAGPAKQRSWPERWRYGGAGHREPGCGEWGSCNATDPSGAGAVLDPPCAPLSRLGQQEFVNLRIVSPHLGERGTRRLALSPEHRAL